MGKRLGTARLHALIEQVTTNTLIKFNLIPRFPPLEDGAELGSRELPFRNVYVGDLHMRNDRGHYTLIEEEEYLSIRNNKNGKLYKFVLEEIEESTTEEGE